MNRFVLEEGVGNAEIEGVAELEEIFASLVAGAMTMGTKNWIDPILH